MTGGVRSGVRAQGVRWVKTRNKKKKERERERKKKEKRTEHRFSESGTPTLKQIRCSTSICAYGQINGMAHNWIVRALAFYSFLSPLAGSISDLEAHGVRLYQTVGLQLHCCILAFYSLPLSFHFDTSTPSLLACPQTSMGATITSLDTEALLATADLTGPVRACIVAGRVKLRCSYVRRVCCCWRGIVEVAP